MPAELAEPGLRLWKGERDTWSILFVPSLGFITQILQDPLHSAPDELLLIGTHAAVRTVALPVGARSVLFEDPEDESAIWDMEAVDLDGDGRYEFFNCSGNWHPARAYDAEGRIRWRYPPSQWGVNQMAPGHLDEDGRLDFVVGLVGDGLRRLDTHGQVVWQLPVGTVWDVELADLDGDGHDEILHSACCGRFFVRAADGSVLSNVKMDPAIPQFELTRWGSADGGYRVGYLREEALWLVRPDGTDRRSLDLGMDSRWGRPSLTSIRLDESEEAGLAVLVDFRLFDRSLLNLYDSEGTLFYQQVLPWSCPSMVVDSRDAAGDVLLLGCDGRLVGNGPHLSVYRRSLAINEAFREADSLALVEDLRAIAWALVHLERSREALDYAKRATDIAETHGTDVNQLARSFNVLGMVELELGRRVQARRHLRHALDLVDPDLPDGPQIQSDIHYNLGTLALGEEQWDRAEQHYLHSLSGNQYTSDAAKAAYNLARVYQEQKRFDEAEEMILMAIDKDSTTYSSDHVEVLKNLELYAEILREAGRIADAQEIEARASSRAMDPQGSAAPTH